MPCTSQELQSHPVQDEELEEGCLALSCGRQSACVQAALGSGDQGNGKHWLHHRSQSHRSPTTRPRHQQHQQQRPHHLPVTSPVPSYEAASLPLVPSFAAAT
eukprot:GHVU01142519.1.p2 GENE.GHVU01142519.1~~GHVU01142519.1.p2  ORF type:complete len:102 (-),score=11.86 GHVU01142519.1:701-1006(-)